MIHIDHLAVLSSLVTGELSRSRKRSSLTEDFADIGPSTEIGNGDLGTDSLELLQLASAVDQMFHLQETGVEEYLLRHRTLRDWAEIVCVSLRKNAERLTFRTSGSTGEPKACIHQVTDLEQEVEAHAAVFGSCKRILTFVPRHHIYGFIWTVMLPVRLGVDVLDVRRWTSSRLVSQLGAGDLLVGTPSVWQYLSDSISTFPSGVAGLTSASPCPAPLYARLQHQGLDLTEIYGSSETGGLGSRQSADLPFELLPFWRRDPSSASSVFRRALPERDEVNAIQVPDYLEWQDECRFIVRERRDGAVQVRGHNVWPANIAHCILSNPAVRECAVRLMRPEEGDRLKAFVVLRRGESGTYTLRELEDWLRTRLSPHEIPGSTIFGAELPRNQMGKLSDWDCSS